MTRGRFVGALAFAALALPSCSRSPDSTPGSGPARGADAAAPDGGRAAGGDGGDPADDPVDACTAALLAGLPSAVEGWDRLGGPVRLFERIRSTVVEFAGRVFRRDRTCVVVAAARPDDAAGLLGTLAKVPGMAASDAGGESFLARSAPEADQVTAWAAAPGGRVVMLRAFGTTDAGALEPFLGALSPDAHAASDGASTGAGTECPAGSGTEDPYEDPTALWGPPPECLAP